MILCSRKYLPQELGVGGRVQKWKGLSSANKVRVGGENLKIERYTEQQDMV